MPLSIIQRLIKLGGNVAVDNIKFLTEEIGRKVIPLPVRHGVKNFVPAQKKNYVTKEQLQPIIKNMGKQNDWSVSMEEEFQRNKRLKAEDVQLLRDWCKENRHLPYLSDHYLAAFLISQDYNIEEAKTTLDKHITFRSQEGWFSGMDPTSEEFQKTMKYYKLALMPERDEENNRIIICKMEHHNTTDYNPVIMFKLIQMVDQVDMLENGFSNGYIFVHDIVNFSMNYVAATPVTIGIKIAQYCQSMLPLKIKTAYLVNGGPAYHVILNIMAPVLMKEVQEKMKGVSTSREMRNHLPAKCLPLEYGGEAGSFENISAKTLQKVCEHHQWFVEEEKRMKVDESKRDKSSSKPSISFWNL